MRGKQIGESLADLLGIGLGVAREASAQTAAASTSEPPEPESRAATAIRTPGNRRMAASTSPSSTR